MEKSLKVAYRTSLGEMIQADALTFLDSLEDESVDLFLTSPPFALLRKKEYGNESQELYLNWLARFGEKVFAKLKSTGSFVLDLGGAYQRGVPVRSLYNFRVLLHFCDTIGFHLAEDFYWYNPSKLPSPIEWVNKRKIRVKDAVNTVWWFSKTEYPKSDVTKVLTPYSARMKKLLDEPSKYFSPKTRPSGHEMSLNFQDNGGAIPPNLLKIPNSESNSSFLANCKTAGLKSHPARFPSKLPEFFIKMLTDRGDLVVDIFAGSNTTGFVAEQLKRQWKGIEIDAYYAAMSAFRFLPANLRRKDLLNIYYSVLANEGLAVKDLLVLGGRIRQKTKSYIQDAQLALSSLEKPSKRDKEILKFLRAAEEEFELAPI